MTDLAGESSCIATLNSGLHMGNDVTLSEFNFIFQHAATFAAINTLLRLLINCLYTG